MLVPYTPEKYQVTKYFSQIYIVTDDVFQRGVFWIQHFLLMRHEIILSLTKGTIFLFVATLGSVGNIMVFVNCIYRFWGEAQKKSIHLILIHLAFANTVILLSKGLPKSIAAFGLRHFLDDTGCKMIVYLERVARDLSICTSSLLTVVQAITISPRGSLCWRFKPKTPWQILPLFPLFWILSSLKSINLLYNITSSRKNTSETSNDNNYCSFQPNNQKIKWIFLILMALHNSMVQGVMGGASGYMIFLLHRHHQHVLYLQSSKLHQALPEIRAAQSVLVLMLCFLFFYWTDYVLSLFLNSVLQNHSAMLDIRELVTCGYAFLCPFVLIQRDGVLTCCNFL
ncbi:olfactory receptor class A-like protein 1 [Perognathus longimembris pacificus]|uniref:olfactory receptor class A-like protein 1 n=1 Tax=Perognathus longimembris pacificus TaxID=214514 RepID=UPI0020185645|nr:olfactory receptor class A-like protein 1 [Perognathus longimembris pacificus]